MTKDDFFGEQTPQSAVKIYLVENYFKTWAAIMEKSAQKNFKDERLAYWDLFSGPGRYKDGTPSTPLKILSHAAKTPYLKENLVTLFNDKNRKFVNSLKKEINNLLNNKPLKHEPKFFRGEVNENLTKQIDNLRLVPSFIFLDPWGYKGLTVVLIESFIKNWGCDCLFFFNYNAINRAIDNDLTDKRLELLFGKDNFKTLKKRIKSLKKRIGDNKNMKSKEREKIILETMVTSLEQRSDGKKCFVLPFRFKTDQILSRQTIHYLIFVTKHFRGYDRMKELMYKKSSKCNQGVANFEYYQRDEIMPEFLGTDTDRPLDQLKEKLLHKYANQKIKVVELYERDSYGTPYIKKNYKDALLDMEQEGTIHVELPTKKESRRDDGQYRLLNDEVERPAKDKNKRRKSMPDDAKIQFGDHNDNKIRN